ncbi:hypothetical protein L7F22_053459 [Adiantum nelumboides]|nr:hypothetical protein [Adiantum nelumboides]
MKKFKHHLKGALHEPHLTLPCSAEPGASVFALCGYRLFKILKANLKGTLLDCPPRFHAREQSRRSPLDGRGLKRWTPLFRKFGQHAFSSVCHSQIPHKCNLYAFKAAGGNVAPTTFQKVVKHSAEPSKYKAGGNCSVRDCKKQRNRFNGPVYSMVFVRAYIHSEEQFLHLKGSKVEFSKGFNWSCWWRTAFRKVFSRSWINVQFSPPSSFGMVIKAVSLALARSHLPLGMVAIIFGGQSIARSQGHSFSYQSSNPSFVLSTLFSFFEFCSIVSRSLYLWILFMPAVITAPLANVFRGRLRQTWLHLVHRTLEFAGAAFIKWGQWAATRPDLFPRDLCIELTKLHANAPAHKFSYTVQTIERAFGKRLNEIFVEFDERPVASGSIAQVHKATLQNSGALGKQKGPMTVAVKVRHPGVTDVIRRDFIIINWVANLSTLIPGLKWLRLDESVRQFAVFMLTQVDLAREAAHLSRFLYNFRSWKDVSFPRPVYPLVHPAVLVESYEQGESVQNFIGLPEESHINRKLAHIGTHTFLKMLLVDNFIHADMHPGNILVRVKRQTKKNGKVSRARSQPHLVFLDVGLTAELSQRDRNKLLEFFKAVALRDGRTAAQCALEFSKNQSCPNPAAFVKELETSFAFWGSKEADAIHPGECMQELLEQVRRHRVNVAGNVCTVMVTIMVLEGWQRRLDPEFSIMHTLQKLLFKQDWAESLAYTINGIMAP